MRRALPSACSARVLVACAAGATLTLSTLGCSDSVSAPVPPAPDALVAELVTSVYLPTFDSLNVRCARLAAALDLLATSPSDGALRAAQDAWRSAREPYERNEAFAFGPLETGGYDPAMDTWPVDRAGIDALLAGSDSISVPLIEGLDGTLKGFHGIEYVLFGLGGGTTPDMLGPREQQYLRAAGASLAGAAAALHAAWSPAGGNFGGQLVSAGQAGSVYVTRGAALQEVVTAMVEPTEEVPNEKIGIPLQTGDRNFEESGFSDNTMADLINDILGVRAVYLGGDSETAGSGVSALVAAQSPALDAQVRSELAQALAALEAVGPSFDTALRTNPASLRAAQQALVALNQTLTQRVVPLVGGGEDDD